MLMSEGTVAEEVNIATIIPVHKSNAKDEISNFIDLYHCYPEL